MSHSSFTVICIKAVSRVGQYDYTRFTGGETETELSGRAGTEMRCWECKSRALFAGSHSLFLLALAEPDNPLNAAEFILAMHP